jgi:hypothetical protein
MQTLDIRAEEIHITTKISAKEIELLRVAMGMCVGGPGKNPIERAAWAFFTGEFWQYIDGMDKQLNREPVAADVMGAGD